MARVTWLIVAVIALTLTVFINDAEARKRRWRGRGYGRSPTFSYRPIEEGEAPERRPSNRRRSSKPLACQLNYLNGTLAWDGSDECPEDAPCTIEVPGRAPYTVDGEDVTVTACDMEGLDYRRPRGRPCLLQFLNETEIHSSTCPAGISCNVSLGIIPDRRSGEAAQAFICDEDDDGHRRKRKCGECRVEYEDGHVEYPKQCRGGPEECTVGPRIETRNGVEVRVFKCQRNRRHHRRDRDDSEDSEEPEDGDSPDEDDDSEDEDTPAAGDGEENGGEGEGNGRQPFDPRDRLVRFNDNAQDQEWGYDVRQEMDQRPRDEDSDQQTRDGARDQWRRDRGRDQQTRIDDRDRQGGDDNGDRWGRNDRRDRYERRGDGDRDQQTRVDDWDQQRRDDNGDQRRRVDRRDRYDRRYGDRPREDRREREYRRNRRRY